MPRNWDNSQIYLVLHNNKAIKSSTNDAKTIATSKGTKSLEKKLYMKIILFIYYY